MMPASKEFTNSIGMKMVRIEPGSFMMGNDQPLLPREVATKRHMARGDWDERPVHKVNISKAFCMGAFEVTNAQYEQFDPEHRNIRGKMGFSKEDDEAVVFVSWHDAVAFCQWLSKKESLPYRLPSEAEWEYACRAGTTTAFWTGETWPVEFRNNPEPSWYPDPGRIGVSNRVVPIFVGKTPPNPWGLHDMHGNVEEWCLNWYGPYEADEATDPVGRIDGDSKVTRGGSHSSEIYHLRSANRLSMAPDDRGWIIGFRVVMGEMPATKPLPLPAPRRFQVDVKQMIPKDITKGPGQTPYFMVPKVFVKVPQDSSGPIFPNHNHCPGLCQCPNGDLLAIWYSTVQEHTRELTVAASRLRYGAEEWDEASWFWGPRDRNNHAPAIWHDGKGTLYHFNGLSVAATWGNLALAMRTSTDNGVTWSKTRLINTEHGPRNMPIESIFRTREGWIVLPCDDPHGTAIHISRDEGKTWQDPGGTIAGIHAGVVQLADGRLMALGRGGDIDGKMPISMSSDMGKTWTYGPSPFLPLQGGQRAVFRRLKEGPLFFASFATAIMITDSSGRQRPVSGLFAAVSFDEGQTWPIMRLVSDDGLGRIVTSTDYRYFVMSFCNGEPTGYMAMCQAVNGVINLITSKTHYAFNLAWLKSPIPAVPTA